MVIIPEFDQPLLVSLGMQKLHSHLLEDSYAVNNFRWILQTIRFIV